MKQIFFVIPTLQGGGAEKVISNLVLNFDKKKYKVSVVVFDLSKQIYLKNKNIKIFHLGNKKITLGLYSFLKVINVNKPDLIISTVSHLNLYISIIKYFFPKKTKVIVRESNFISKNIYLQASSTLFKILYRIFYNNVDISLVFSKKHKLDILKNTNIKKHKIKIIGNPVNINLIQNLSKKKISTKYKKFFVKKKIIKFIYVGSLSYQKGLDILINSLAYLDKSKFILNIIGQGSEKRRLKELVLEKKLNNNINFLPYLINPFPLITNSDAYVMFSRFEGMSNIILEVLALNKPIIYLNNSGASTEILKNVNSSYIINSKEPFKIAKKIKMFRSKNFYSSNNNILKKFDIKEIIKKYENIIDDII